MFKMGAKVTDKISGLTGIVTGKLEYLNGCVQYWIQPPAKDNKEGDGYYTGDVNLVAVEGGIDVPQFTRQHLFKLGEELRDRVSGFKGIAVTRVTSLRLCVSYGLASKAKKGEEPIKNQYFDDQQLERVGKGVYVARANTGAPNCKSAP